MIWDWAYALEVLPLLLEGLVVTILATVLGFALAATVGLVWAVVRLVAGRGLAAGVGLTVEFLRSTPLLVQLYFLYFLLPEAGISLGPLVVGVIGLGLHYSAYIAEVYRSGLEGVGQGQWDAARSLNLTRTQTLLHVVLPQAIPPILPSLGNRFIAIMKETPLLAVITVTELLQQARLAAAESFRYVEPLTMVGLFFLVFSLVASGVVQRLERRVRHAT